MTPVDVVVKLIELAISLVGKEAVRKIIDEDTVKAVDLVTDAAELIKFGGKSSE